MTHINQRLRFLEELKDDGHSHLAMFVISVEDLYLLPAFQDLLRTKFGDDESSAVEDAKWAFAKYVWSNIVSQVDDDFMAAVSDEVTGVINTSFQSIVDEIHNEEGPMGKELASLLATIKPG